jgi:hypothetical protein
VGLIPFSLQTVVRICCIRSFGHFIARLQGSILQFNPEVGIFVSIAQSEQESLLQQAQAQFRMVSQVFGYSPSSGSSAHWTPQETRAGGSATLAVLT